MLNAMVWIARSGAPWRDLPERYGPWETVYSRFRKWIDDGILDNIFRVLSLEAELEELSLDATIVQAHQHSAGAKKGGLQTKSDTAAEGRFQNPRRRRRVWIPCISLCSVKDTNYYLPILKILRLQIVLYHPEKTAHSVFAVLLPF